MESAHIAHRDELFDSAKELGIVESCLIHLMKNVAALVRQFASATHHKRFWHSTHAHTISIKLELVLHDLLRAYVEAFFKVLDPYFGNRVRVVAVLVSLLIRVNMHPARFFNKSRKLLASWGVEGVGGGGGIHRECPHIELTAHLSLQRSQIPCVSLADLDQRQRVTFEIECDNGFENTDSTMKGCYTIVNVD